jgi:hypothetical protein
MANRPIDPRGWLIPAEGTKSRYVYDMIQIGTSTAAMAQALAISKSNIHHIIYRIRHPLLARTKHRIIMRRRRGSTHVSP